MLMSSSPSPSPSFHPPPHCSPSVSGSGYRSPPSSSSSSARRPVPSPRPFARSASSANPPAYSPKPSGASSTPQRSTILPPSSETSKSSTYVDSGTQFSPVDWPPTSSRAAVNIERLNLRASNEPAIPTANTAVTTATSVVAQPQPPSARESPQPSQGHAESAGTAAPKSIVSDSVPPPEPVLRVTPQSALNNVSSSATNVLRRERSSTTDPNSPEEESSDSAPSAPKRPRSDDVEIKTLPVDYVDCDTSDLTVLISDMLLELIRYNDEIPLKEGELTRFHSRAAPGISVRDYLKRLTFHATLLPPILLSMVCYIDKLCTAFPAFTINSLTVHRFLITAATVASKGLSDSFWTNNTYARVGGVTMKELALLELELLSKVEWRIVPTPEKLEEYYRNLIERHPDYALEAAADAANTNDAMDTTAEIVSENNAASTG